MAKDPERIGDGASPVDVVGDHFPMEERPWLMEAYDAPLELVELKATPRDLGYAQALADFQAAVCRGTLMIRTFEDAKRDLRAERRPMWCDDFDGDLYRLLPEAEDILVPLAGITLSVHSSTTHGRINCPCCWHGDYRLETPFGYRQPWRDAPKPAHYSTSAPLVECTAEEAARDLWSHQHAMYVDGVLIEDWGRIVGPYFTVLFAARGSAQPLDPAELERAKETLRETLRRYVSRLLALIQGGVVEPYPFSPLTPEEAGDPPDDLDDEVEYGDDEDKNNEDWDETPDDDEADWHTGHVGDNFDDPDEDEE